VGLGVMGGAIARHLVAAGFRTIGYDPSPDACGAAGAVGVDVRALPELIAAAQVILTSLPSFAAALSTADTIAKTAPTPRIVADLSTFTLTEKTGFADRLIPHGHIALDCPLSGTGAQAQTGDLVVYASGPPDVIAALSEIFAAFARRTFDLGAFGNGTKMKLVANLLVAINNVASAEAMVLGRRAGLDPEVMLEAVGAGAAHSRIFELRAPMMARRAYTPATMKLSVWAKDMAAIAAFARGLDCPVPLFATTAPLYEAALAQGGGELDTAAVCTVLEAMAAAADGGGREPSC
jgi:3-hydroxyisobutyrate dehydrogenase-like beta-hydroxyacid dehydrogenase